MVNIANFFHNISQKFRKIYLNSNFYDKKISKTENRDLIYKPSPYLLSSLIKYQKKKFKIDDFSLDDVWNNKNLTIKEYKNLNNFFGFSA